MTDEQMIYKLMCMEGIKETNISIYDGSDHRIPSREIWFEYPDGTNIKECPKYLTDHNAIQRVIEGLPRADLYEYTTSLMDVYGEFDWGGQAFALATPYQKSAAVIMMMENKKNKVW